MQVLVVGVPKTRLLARCVVVTRISPLLYHCEVLMLACYTTVGPIRCVHFGVSVRFGYVEVQINVHNGAEKQGDARSGRIFLVRQSWGLRGRCVQTRALLS
jgi:hypothetical protein